MREYDKDAVSRNPFDFSAILNRLQARVTMNNFTDRYYQERQKYNQTSMIQKYDESTVLTVPILASIEGLKVWRSLNADSFFDGILSTLLAMPQLNANTRHACPIPRPCTRDITYSYEYHMSISAVIIAMDRLVDMGYNGSTKEYHWHERHWEIIRETYRDLMDRGCVVTATPFSYFVDRESVHRYCAKASGYLARHTANANEHNISR